MLSWAIKYVFSSSLLIGKLSWHNTDVESEKVRGDLELNKSRIKVATTSCSLRRTWDCTMP